jgi:hypothetical protein
MRNSPRQTRAKHLSEPRAILTFVLLKLPTLSLFKLTVVTSLDAAIRRYDGPLRRASGSSFTLIVLILALSGY